MIKQLKRLNKCVFIFYFNFIFIVNSFLKNTFMLSMLSTEKKNISIIIFSTTNKSFNFKISYSLFIHYT